MSSELASMYVPADVEPDITKLWNDANAFHATPEDKGVPYSIVIPPPNVTAALHMGHALNNTLQDILTRYHRMVGFNAMWMPGTDHAGIATQTVVDKRLQAEGKPALKEHKQMELNGEGGRDKFIALVQDWKDEYEGRITDQLKAMGCSCDWDRQRFTMDETCAKAVREAFFQLFKDGLIYRGKRLVNWDPATQTALADDEVEMRDIDGFFYYMKYPICDEQGNLTGEFATVATTRPETMLGDTAVAVNPDDPKNKHTIGQFVKLPIVDRIIPIIGDDYVVIGDPESSDEKAKFASGFLKVTPAHDPNDYMIGQRHDLPIINVMALDGSISITHGWPESEKPEANETLKPFVGLSREEARKAIIKWFEANDLFVEKKPYKHSVGHSYRSHVPVEPYLSDQWYVKVTDDRLAGAALNAMSPTQRQQSEGCVWKEGASFTEDTGELTFYPPRYAKNFQSWHENIRDWCISRQLWWGHRIPVWTFKFNNVGPQSFTLGERESAWKQTEVHQQKIERAIYGIFEVAGLPDESFVRWTDDPETCHIVAQTEAAGHLLEKLIQWISRPVVNGSLQVEYPDTDIFDEYLSQLPECLEAHQDPDVLDTWFSSGLWPMSTMGWPEETDVLKTWNPSTVLCTAREIITLWVSRMVMFNRYFRKGDLPFKDVFIHAMIQDGHGQKMSKSLGNGVDPFDIIHSHGSDAMRFTLASMTTQTQDVRLPVDMVCPHTGESFTPKYVGDGRGHKVAAPVQDSPSAKGKKMVSSYGVASGKQAPTDDMPAARNTSEKFDLGRNFANKLWNAVRFSLSNIEGIDANASGGDLTLADKWILSRLAQTIASTTKAIKGYEFKPYADGLYDFIWRDFCDWYIEAVKPTIKTNPAQANVLTTVLDTILRLLHPAMPYITEKLWERLNEVVPQRGVEGLQLPASDLLVKAAWPVADESLIDTDALKEFDLLVDVVTAVRQVRTAYKIPPRQQVVCSIKASGENATLLQASGGGGLLKTFAAISELNVAADMTKPQNAASAVLGDMEVYLHDLVNADEEKERLTKLIADAEKQAKGLEGRLSNPNYAEKAPAHLVQQTRDQLAAKQAELESLKQQLASL
ncbi:MAG: valine--tRNA ligase [Phycisphaeraceae bacterium]|nr:valine--tRNA ligase [Phycisphaeraceae bacterium]